MPKDRKPTEETVNVAIQRMIGNANEYMADASILLDAEQWRGAYALATLALEEIGKAWTLVQQIGSPEERVAGLRRVQRQHAAKLAAARQLAAFADGVRNREVNINWWFSEEHDYLADSDHDLRMSGMYVDIDGDEVTGGPGSIGEDLAQQQVAFAHSLIHVALGLARQAPPVRSDSDDLPDGLRDAPRPKADDSSAAPTSRAAIPYAVDPPAGERAATPAATSSGP